MTDLQGQVILVTGSTTGIGAAFTQLACESGASVVAVGRRQEAVDDLLASLGGRPVVGVVADVTQSDQVLAAVQMAEHEFGSLTGTFNNAGFVGKFVELHEQTEEAFDHIIRTNVHGSFHVLKHSMAAMRKAGKGGAIVSTSSTAGHRGMASIGAYVASKHAVEGLTRTAALEGAPVGIRVNAVAPGFADTKMMRLTHEALNPDDPDLVMAQFAEGIPLGRYAEPVEIARAAAWLLSDEASYVTGQVFDIDGGGTTGY